MWLWTTARLTIDSVWIQGRNMFDYSAVVLISCGFILATFTYISLLLFLCYRLYQLIHLVVVLNVKAVNLILF